MDSASSLPYWRALGVPGADGSFNRTFIMLRNFSSRLKRNSSRPCCGSFIPAPATRRLVLLQDSLEHSGNRVGPFLDIFGRQLPSDLGQINFVEEKIQASPIGRALQEMARAALYVVPSSVRLQHRHQPRGARSFLGDAPVEPVFNRRRQIGVALGADDEQVGNAALQ